MNGWDMVFTIGYFYSFAVDGSALADDDDNG
jgi:hypothetical protein